VGVHPSEGKAHFLILKSTNVEYKNMQEAKKCPKCGNALERGSLRWGLNLMKQGDIQGDIIVPFHCKNCGYIEFYNGKYTVGL
jgi:predicted nucleic-acid-binding Zn-ribbon protein